MYYILVATGPTPFDADFFCQAFTYFIQLENMHYSSPRANNALLHPPSVSLDIVVCLDILTASCSLSITRARNLFFNAYYDPFNPELHLYIFKSDSLHHLESSSTLWPNALLHAGSEAWSTWFESLGDYYREYIGQFWTMDLQLNNSWPPT